MKYVFIGDGRLAKHLSAYLTDESRPHTIWSRRSDLDLKNIINPEDIVCLTVADSDLAHWAEFVLTNFPENKIIHFSGVSFIPGVLSYHPLMTFSHELYDLDFYRQIPIVGEVGQPRFDEIFPGLANPYFEITPHLKSRYHALVTMAANFPQLLWREIAGDMRYSLNLDFSLLGPLLLRSLLNSIGSPDMAPTGPLVRKDLKTVYKHLDSLERDDLKGIYYSFLNLHRELLFASMEEPNDPN